MGVVNKLQKIIGGLCWLGLASTQIFAQPGEASRNVQIQVEFKSAEFTSGPFAQDTRVSHETQMLVVMDGLEGRLFIGKEIPYTSVAWFQNYLTGEGYLARAVKLQNVGTSLVVTPKILGKEIELTLTPEVSYETGGGTGSIAVRKLSTSVRVPDGQPIEIGSASEKSEFENHFYRRQTGEAVRILLTPKILETT